jgi:hypothetical protein
MTEFLTSMRTILPRFHASLSAPFFHQLLDCCEALSFWMANFLADMSTSERNTALLTTIWWSGVAVHSLKGLLTTETGLCNRLKARWAVAKMALEVTRVTAGQNLFAWASTCRLNSSTLDWRIQLGYAAWAKEWLSGIDSTRLAGPYVTKVVAFMNSTR